MPWVLGGESVLATYPRLLGVPSRCEHQGTQRGSKLIGKKAKWTGSAVLAGGLLITGVAVGGSATPVTHPKTKSAASVTGTYADLDACGLMAQGRQGGCVEQLQLDLNDAENAGLTLDGHFGPSTEQAVIQFQKTTGVTPDGVVGAATKAALENAIGAA